MTSAMHERPRRFDREVDGIVLLDKPSGMSSNSALQQVRVLYRALKAGHTGTLDPLASGMLPLCFGQATKVCGFLLDSNKSYRFTARLGERTDTGDADGQIIERKIVPALDEQRIREVLTASVGPQEQVPPMHSALKHQGERLYDIARRGEQVERAARRIVIHSLQLNGVSDGLDITVRCSKGTYVRTLAEDLAAKLGTVAHLTSLRRLGVDPFCDLPMASMDKLMAAAATGPAALDDFLLPADRALPQLAAVRVDASGCGQLLHGQAAEGLPDLRASLAPEQLVRLYGPDGRFLGLGQVAADGRFQPRRLLVKSASGL